MCIRDRAAPEQELPRLYLALMLFRQPVEADQHVHKRLRLRHDTMRLLSDMRALQRHLPDLARPALRISEIDEILRPIDAAARLVVRVASESWLVQQRMDLYERSLKPVSYTHLRAHETVLDLVCRLLLEKKNNISSLRISRYRTNTD